VSRSPLRKKEKQKDPESAPPVTSVEVRIVVRQRMFGRNKPRGLPVLLLLLLLLLSLLLPRDKERKSVSRPPRRRTRQTTRDPAPRARRPLSVRPLAASSTPRDKDRESV
jgi:hypothetical protein